MISFIRVDCRPEYIEIQRELNWHDGFQEIRVTSPCHVSRARNFGVDSAESEWIMFLDADCELNRVDKSRLADRLAGVSTTDRKILGLLYGLDHSGGFWARTYNWIQRTWVLASLSKSGKVENLLGGALIIRKRDFMRSGGFDLNIAWGGEDTEFIRRAQKQGLSTELIQGIEVQHLQTLGIAGFLRRAWMQGLRRGKCQLQSSSIKNNVNFKNLSGWQWGGVTLFWCTMRLASALGSIMCVPLPKLSFKWFEFLAAGFTANFKFAVSQRR